jgi:Outer membrane protein beta-barrel domain
MWQNFKIFIFCVCLANISLDSTAQVTWGIKGGLNLSTTIYPGGENNGYILAFNSGVYAEIKFSSRFSLMPELAYSLKGNAVSDSSIFLMNYISMPVLVEYKIVGNLAAIAGPECSYLINSFFKPAQAGFNPTSFYRHIDFGYVLGLRYGLGKHLGVDFRWDRGVIGIFKPNQPQYITDGNGTWIYQGTLTLPNKENPRNQCFQLGIYYGFKL